MSGEARRYLGLVSLVVLLCTYGWATGSGAGVVLSLGFLLGGLVLDRGFQIKLDLPFIVHVLLLLPALLLALLSHGVVGPGLGSTGTQLPPLYGALSLFALLLVILRRLSVDPPFGEAVTAALGLVCLLLLGQARYGWVYKVCTAAFLLTSLLPIVSFSLLPRAQKVLVLLPVLSFGGAALLVWPLMPLQEWVQRWLGESAAAAEAEVANQVGFREGMDLGELRGMLDSDRVVMRVHGGRTDYLRGIVYNAYHAGHWEEGKKPGHSKVDTDGSHPPPGEKGVLSIEPMAGTGTRFFLPLALTALWTESGTVYASTLGEIYQDTVVQKRIYFRQGPGPRTVTWLSPPMPVESHLPPNLKEPIQKIAKEWIGDKVRPEDKLAAIIGRLKAEYRYSLRYQRGSRKDPLLEFLHNRKEGHCEYFASAMVMLARASSIPARVAAGYRVREWNRLGGYYVVRERNAHAWVEAYLPDHGWTTYDPTPPLSEGSPDNQEQASLLGELVDYLRYLGGRLGDMGLVAISLTIVFVLLIVWIVYRLVMRRAALAKLAKERIFPEPLPEFVQLCLALSKQGLLRNDAETLEQFARRLGDSPAAPLVARYASLRYGGLGDDVELRRELSQLARRLLDLRS